MSTLAFRGEWIALDVPSGPLQVVPTWRFMVVISGILGVLSRIYKALYGFYKGRFMGRSKWRYK